MRTEVDAVWSLIDDDLDPHQLVVKSLDVWKVSGAESVRIAWTLAVLVAGFVSPRPAEETTARAIPVSVPPTVLLAFAEPDWDALHAAQGAWALIVGSGDHDGSAVVGPVMLEKLRRFARTYDGTGLLMLVSWCRLFREELAGTRAGRDLDSLLDVLRTELWNTPAVPPATDQPWEGRGGESLPAAHRPPPVQAPPAV